MAEKMPGMTSSPVLNRDLIYDRRSIRAKDELFRAKKGKNKTDKHVAIKKQMDLIRNPKSLE
ncbi:hypothetical protein TcasGA2_TC008624 [Tribolium castaneum]|uniref:Uncharacterized protein n=1 Tax=Tribolium castaneum TaxID=7070 RepID=D6WTJ5_TRICA|nr:hypothetical protein TcasGA2_TC008624 [Tribolium castaneum]